MNPQTLLLRQVHPDFFKDEKLSSQAFFPFPKDKNHLSAYDGDQVSALVAYQHYTTALKFQSIGVWAVNHAECSNEGLSSQPDPLPESPAHVIIDFAGRSEKECRKLAKKLRDHAQARGCLHRPDAA